tara:strand:- start:741 stop:992 length:252 start_codon:yes stop_codon:yes gene_type:complete
MPRRGIELSFGQLLQVEFHHALLFFFIFLFFSIEKKEKKIGDEEVDIQHRMDNRCVFCHSVFCLKKKHRALDLKKMFSALRKF